MKRRNWIILGVIVAAIAGYLLWKALNPPPPVALYKTAEVGTGDLTEEITANGVINPVRVVSVGTQVSGTVQALYADFNDRVTAGQVLLRLDPALFTSRLQASEAALANARASAALQAANAARAAQLVKQDYISRQDYETTLASAKGAAAQVAQAEAQIAKTVPISISASSAPRCRGWSSAARSISARRWRRRSTPRRCSRSPAI